ncbi:MAG: AI-2E family transporter [Lachnospiraceae bacterium]|nr:AI-2E family transporter [Lachnospiraceae bacterium]
MRKINKKYIQIGIIALLVVCLSLLFNHFLKNRSLPDSTSVNVGKVMLPIIDGCALAYFLNPLMKTIENKIMSPLFTKLKVKNIEGKRSSIRGLSIALTLIIFLLIVAGLILLIVPQLLDSIQSIILRFPSYVKSFNRWSDQFLVRYPQLRSMLDNYWENITDYAMKEILPKIQGLISTLSTTVLGSVWGILVFIFKLIIGMILSVYLLFHKETYGAQAKKIAYSLFDEERANNLINNTRFANKTFGGFISGKIVDSIIIGMICFIGTSLMQTPYALLISVIVGVTNIIPFFGPYLGAIPSGFIILMINPLKCLWFLIFLLILQQIDGNIIGPKILGDSTGLSSFWVVFAITLFGGFFGVVGMFVGVPIFAIIYAGIKTFIDTRLERKKLPVETSFYMNSDYHSDISKGVVNSGDSIRFVDKTFSDVSSYGNNLTDATMDLEFEDEDEADGEGSEGSENQLFAKDNFNEELSNETL